MAAGNGKRSIFIFYYSSLFLISVYLYPPLALRVLLLSYLPQYFTPKDNQLGT